MKGGESADSYVIGRLKMACLHVKHLWDRLQKHIVSYGEPTSVYEMMGFPAA